MKNKKLNKTIILMFVMTLLILINSNKAFASVEIRDVDDNNAVVTVYTNKNISYFYDLCKHMVDAGQGLENCNVNSRMANNRDWATVSYFSNSNYGTTGAGKNSGVDVQITADRTRKSTNGNITGIMDWGRSYTFTAGIIADYASTSLSTAGGPIINDAETSAVDKFSASTSAQAIARNGWYISFNYIGDNASYPYSIRQGLFGFGGGSTVSTTGSGIYYAASGDAHRAVTFRPVFSAQ